MYIADFLSVLKECGGQRVLSLSTPREIGMFLYIGCIVHLPVSQLGYHMLIELTSGLSSDA